MSLFWNIFSICNCFMCNITDAQRIEVNSKFHINIVVQIFRTWWVNINSWLCTFGKKFRCFFFYPLNRGFYTLFKGTVIHPPPQLPPLQERERCSLHKWLPFFFFWLGVNGFAFCSHTHTHTHAKSLWVCEHVHSRGALIMVSKLRYCRIREIFL